MKRVFNSPGASAARLQVSVPDEEEPVREIDHIRWLSQMQADLAESLGGVMLQAARPVPIGTAAAGTLTPIRSAGRLVGVSLHETGGTNPGVVRLWDGRDTNGTLIACVSVGAGLANLQWISPGVSFVNGIFVEVVTGTVEGVVYLGAAD